MSDKDIRWKQRFSNFEKAMDNLERASDITDPSDVERAGIIQFFEIAFELAWKTLKDFLGEAGYDIKSPRDTIKQAFQNNIIENGHIWLEMLEKRNELTHTYDEQTAEYALKKITEDYIPHLFKLYEYLKKR